MLIVSQVIVTICDVSECNAYPITSDHHRMRSKRGNPGLQQLTPKFGTKASTPVGLALGP